MLDPKASYTVTYEKQVLTIAVGCNDSRYVDLDEPRVGVVATISDTTFRGACNGAPARVSFDSPEAARAPGVLVTPNECADLFRTAPVAEDTSNPTNRGDVFCVATPADDARLQGFPRRIAVIEVVGISTDGKITISVDAWNSPF